MPGSAAMLSITVEVSTATTPTGTPPSRARPVTTVRAQPACTWWSRGGCVRKRGPECVCSLRSGCPALLPGCDQGVAWPPACFSAAAGQQSGQACCRASFAGTPAPHLRLGPAATVKQAALPARGALHASDGGTRVQLFACKEGGGRRGETQLARNAPAQSYATIGSLPHTQHLAPIHNLFTPW